MHEFNYQEASSFVCGALKPTPYCSLGLFWWVLGTCSEGWARDTSAGTLASIVLMVAWFSKGLSKESTNSGVLLA